MSRWRLMPSKPVPRLYFGFTVAAAVCETILAARGGSFLMMVAAALLWLSVALTIFGPGIEPKGPWDKRRAPPD